MIQRDRGWRADDDAARGLSRRRFLVVAAGGVTSTVLAACGGTKVPGSGGAAAGSPATRVGGSATGGIIRPFDTFDPQNATGTLDTVSHLFDGLYEVDYYTDDLAPRSVLAEGPPRKVADDRYRIAFRRGGIFHDGSPITAQDVVFSIMRSARPPKGQVSVYAQYLAFIRDVRVVGERTIEVQVAHPVNDDVLDRRLAVPAIAVVPRAVVQKLGPQRFGAKPVGSGPYKFLQAVENQGIKMQRYPRYKGPSGGYLQNITFDILTSDPARVAALKSDRVQVAQTMPFRDVRGLESQQIDVEDVPTSAAVWLTFDNSKAPFSDRRVRQALHYAIDRDSITQVAYGGNATPGTSVLPEFHPDYIRPNPVYTHDPERAKALLQQAGVRPGTAIKVDVQQADFISATADVVRQNWEDLGLKVSLNVAPVPVIAGRILKGGPFDVVISDGNPGGIAFDVPGYVTQYYVPGAFRDAFLRWKDSQAQAFAQLVVQAEQAQGGQAKRLFDRIQQVLAEQVPAYPLHFYKETTGVRPAELKDYRAPRSGFLDLRRAIAA